MVILQIVALVLMLFFASAVGSDGAELNCGTQTFSNEKFIRPQTRFSVYEKVFLRAVCLGLVPGEYEMLAVWYNPLQQVQRQEKHSFYIGSVSGYSTFFWMKVLKRGLLSAAVSDGSYSGKYFGNWSVKLYLNQTAMEPVEFIIQE